MVSKETLVNVIDNTGVVWLKLFQLYGGSTRKHTTIGMFTKGSAKLVKPPFIPFKGFKYKVYRKGFISKNYILTNKYKLFNKSIISFNTNILNTILTKKKNIPRSKYFFSVTFHAIRNKKMVNLFKAIY